MADETKKRTTSFAKHLEDLAKQPSPLDHIPGMREEFNRLSEQSRQETQRERQTDERMPSHAPRPEMHLRPEGPIRRAVDRKIDYEKIRKIAVAVRKRREAARDLSRDFDRER